MLGRVDFTRASELFPSCATRKAKAIMTRRTTYASAYMMAIIAGLGGSGCGSTDNEGVAQSSAEPVTSSSCSCAGGPSDCAVWDHVFMTNYGFNDNSCQEESEHNCATIAYPGLGPKKHKEATEAKGTYDDPITAAASASNSGTSELESQRGATLKPGTIIYNPLTEKYYIMEDECAECTAAYNCKYDDDEDHSSKNPPTGCGKNQYFHIDFWMGPSVSQANPAKLNDCEDDTTIGDSYDVNGAETGSRGSATTDGTVIINPPDNLPVRSGVLFAGTSSGNGGCWTKTQRTPNDEWCH
jgi:hypothetical protein